ncbi:MAG: hypothetical protein OEM26_19220, partial [Saprospiraceae bacterium]|nr:hypothetical protein [Saprospiraceae bacterium]
MAKLSVLELQDLIDSYKSDLRKLEYQASSLKGMIADLSKQLGVESKKVKKKRGPGRPRKSTTAAKATAKKRGPGRP